MGRSANDAGTMMSALEKIRNIRPLVGDVWRRFRGNTNADFGMRNADLKMKRKYWVLLICFVFILLLDQYTKYEAQRRIRLYQTIKVIAGFFNLTHLRNNGGAFGILAGKKEGIASLFFIAFPLMAVRILCFFLS